MLITKEDVEEFKVHVKEVYGEEFTLEKAEKELLRLRRLFEFLARTPLSLEKEDASIAR